MHTKEPWFVRTLERNAETVDCFVAAKDVNGFAYDAEILGDDEYRDESGGIDRKLADSRRIVACVNACAGLRTEDLESVSGLGFPAQKLIEQRDELLAALKGLEAEFRKVFPVYYYAEPWAHDTNVPLKIAQVAIAKADLHNDVS